MIGKGPWFGRDRHQISRQPADSRQACRDHGSSRGQVLQSLQGETAAIEGTVTVRHNAHVYQTEVAGQGIEWLRPDPTDVWALQQGVKPAWLEGRISRTDQ